MDRLRLHGIRIFTRVGHTQAERDTGHHLRVDLTLAMDLRGPGRSDDMEDAVDYVLLHDALQDALEDQRFHLLEAAAETAAEAVLEALRETGRAADVSEVTVRARKDHPPIPHAHVEAASVEITRSP